MSFFSMTGISKLFGGASLTEEERANLVKEVMLMTLARAAASDTNIKSVEIDKVQEVLQARTGEEIPTSEIRVAANSALFEKVSLDKYLARSGKNLELEERVEIINALREVIGSDDRISEMEQDFFNMVVEALDIPAANL
ncbi:MAG: hypothetical protein CMP82_14745 [Gammaproteobacteria bacterium]|nr:hypothetical protein [Gammaproteobacteria bacterium]|tara:strand:+ start:101 stop:520 length:420 start_codon:yes stop_codon:yes gene_type:complete